MSNDRDTKTTLAIDEAEAQIKDLDSTVRAALSEAQRLFDCGFYDRAHAATTSAQEALVQMVALEEAVKELRRMAKPKP